VAALSPFGGPAVHAIWAGVFTSVPDVEVRELRDRDLMSDESVDAIVLAGQILEIYSRLRNPAAGETYDDGYPSRDVAHIMYARQNLELSRSRCVPWIVTPPFWSDFAHRHSLPTSENAAADFRAILDRIETFNRGEWLPHIHKLALHVLYFWGARPETAEPVASALRSTYLSV
jgi:hypothetical protein